MGYSKFVGFRKAMNESIEKRRILFLFAHLHKGGMQRAVSNISTALPVNFEQHVGFFGTEHPPFEYNAELHNFHVPGSLKLGPFKKIKNLYLRLSKLRKFVKANRIAVVVSFGEAANLLNVLSFNSAYSILSIRSSIGGYGKTDIYSRVYRVVIRWLYPLADAIVAVSYDLKMQIEKIMLSRIPVCHIPNLYHLNRIKELSVANLPMENIFLNETNFLLNVGSLIREKGQDILIKAFAKVSDRYPELLLVLIGRGPERERFIAESERMGVRDRVVVIDFDSNPYRYMKAATIFILPSLTEGFPNVLVEAMACGCPTIAFDCQTGPREILGESQYGELVEDIRVVELAKRIDKLLSSPKRLVHLKEQSLIRAAHYDANVVIDRWTHILEGHD